MLGANQKFSYFTSIFVMWYPLVWDWTVLTQISSVISQNNKIFSWLLLNQITFNAHSALNIHSWSLFCSTNICKIANRFFYFHVFHRITVTPFWLSAKKKLFVWLVNYSITDPLNSWWINSGIIYPLECCQVCCF